MKTNENQKGNEITKLIRMISLPSFRKYSDKENCVFTNLQIQTKTKSPKKSKKLVFFQPKKSIFQRNTDSMITKSQMKIFTKTNTFMKKIETKQFDSINENIQNRMIAKASKFYNINRSDFNYKIQKDLKLKKDSYIIFRIEININDFPIKIKFFPIINFKLNTFVNDLTYLEKEMGIYNKYFLINKEDFPNIKNFEFLNLKIQVFENCNLSIKIILNKKSNLKIFKFLR